MLDYLYINNFIIFLINVFGYWLAFWVYKNEQRGRANKSFSLMVITILSWITFYQFASITDNQKLSLVMFRLSGGSVFLFFICYYFTINWFIKEKIVYGALGRIVLAYGVIFSILTIYTPFIIPGIKVELWGSYPVFSSFGWYFFYGYAVVLTLLINSFLMRSYFISPQQKKIKLQYFIIGLVLFATLNFIFNVILPVYSNNYQYYQLGNYSIIFLIGFTLYAIQRHELMGIKALFTQVLIAVMSMILIGDIILLSDDVTVRILKIFVLVTFLYFSRELVRSVKREKSARSELEKAYDQINHYVEQLEEINIHLAERNEDLKALLEASGKASEILDPKKIAQEIVNSIPKNLKHLGYLGGIISLYDKEKNTISTFAITESKIVEKAKTFLNKPFEKYKQDIAKVNNLTAKTIKDRKIYSGNSLAEFVSPTVGKMIADIIQKTVRANSFISIPLYSRGKVIGVILFVGKKPIEEIVQRDKDMLYMFSSHVGGAIENARLYEKTNDQMKELEKLNNKLESANENLKELLEMKNEFLHITSHQLRTPLTAIRGMLSMWYEGDFDNMSEAEKKDMLKRIYTSTERLNNITNDMLDALEIEGGFLKFQFSDFSVKDIVKETIETLKTSYDAKGLYINFSSEDNLPNVRVEQNYIRQVFMNVIDNAGKYTKKGGVDISVKLNGKYVETTVKDTGVGASKEDQKRLFEKFTRGKNAIKENAAGSGLGLFIARKIVEKHHGKMSFSSEGLGMGSTVIIDLLAKKAGD